jgi:hypothetical protein
MYVKLDSDTYLTLCFRVGFRYEFISSFLSTEQLSIQSRPPHNFAKVDFTIKWNIVSLQIDMMTFMIF